MKILSVEGHDYGSLHGAHVFRLSDRGLTFVMGDNQDEPRMNSNGAGKSTIFDFLDWVLFGVVPKDDHVDSIINDEANECQGIARLDDDGLPMVVERTKRRGKSGSLRFWRGDELTEALDVKETQRLLEQHLGLDREVFHATVLYSQTDVLHYADTKSDAARMDILTKILQLGDVDVWLERAKEKVKEIGNTISSQRFAVAQLQGKIDALAPQIHSFDLEASRWEAERGESLQRAIKQLDEFRSNVAKAEEVVAKEDSVRAMQSVFNPMGAQTYDWSDFDRRIAKARDVENRWRAKVAETAANGKAKNVQRSGLGSGICTACGQELPNKEHIEREIRKLDGEIEALRVQWSHDTAKLKEAESARQGIEQQKAEVRRQHAAADLDIAKRDAEAKALLKEIEDNKRFLEQAKPHIEYLHKTMAETQAKVNPWLARKSDAELDLARWTGDKVGAEQELQAAESVLEYYEFWVKGFGLKGIKSYILDSRLQEMTDSANQWVKLLTGGTFWIRFETQTMGRSTKKLSNKLNIRVFKYNPDGTIRERNYPSYSGGQKKRISWAIDFGLSRLIAARATKRYDLLILDEVFKFVDTAGGEAVVEMLQYLRQEKTSIFVIEHDSAFQTHFENLVMARYRNARTTILENYSAQEQIQAPQEETGPSDGESRTTKPAGKKKRKRVPRRSPVRRK